MEVRQIATEEYDQFRRICKYAFTVLPEVMPYWLPDDLDLTWTRAVFDNGKMASITQVIPFRVFYGDALIPMGGYSGVATPPEYRRKGYVRQLLFHSLKDMRDNGVPLSYLYPFEFSYYRKFGWEQASVFHNLTFSGSVFHGIKEVEGAMEQKAPEDIEEMNTVYETFAKRYTSACVRDKRYWKMILTPPKRNRFAYLWRNSQGEPRGYIMFDNQEKTGGSEFEVNMLTREWAALDHEARLGVFRFLRDHDSQINEIMLRTAPGVPVRAYMNNPRCKYQVEPGCMARIVDVKQAFEVKSYPPGLAGKVRFRVKDDFCEWNDHVFTLTIEGGKAEVTTGGSEADFSTDICCLAAIYTGFWSLGYSFEVDRIHDISWEDVQRFSPLFREKIPYLINFF
jgi:predicted acetyltransferase